MDVQLPISRSVHMWKFDVEHVTRNHRRKQARLNILRTIVLSNDSTSNVISQIGGFGISLMYVPSPWTPGHANKSQKPFYYYYRWLFYHGNHTHTHIHTCTHARARAHTSRDTRTHNVTRAYTPNHTHALTYVRTYRIFVNYHEPSWHAVPVNYQNNTVDFFRTQLLLPSCYPRTMCVYLHASPTTTNLSGMLYRSTSSH